MDVANIPDEQWASFLRPRAKPWHGQACTSYQRKYDGHRITLYQCRKKLYVMSRTTFIQDKLTYLTWYAKLRISLPAKTALDCELFSEGRTATDIPTLLKVKSHELYLAPFAIPYYQGKDYRSKPLAYCMGMIDDFIGNVAGIIPAQTFVVPNWDRDTLLQRARRFNWEGLMLKYGHYAHWYKLKLEETVDLVVLGFEEGEGKYAGKVGAIRAGSVEGQDLCTVSGMTDEQRFSLSDRDIGRVIEVKHNGLCTKGGLRHPRFIRWRDDKRARECSYDAIMKELKK